MNNTIQVELRTANSKLARGRLDPVFVIERLKGAISVLDDLFDRKVYPGDTLSCTGAQKLVEDPLYEVTVVGPKEL